MRKCDDVKVKAWYCESWLEHSRTVLGNCLSVSLWVQGGLTFDDSLANALRIYFCILLMLIHLKFMIQ